MRSIRGARYRDAALDDSTNARKKDATAATLGLNVQTTQPQRSKRPQPQPQLQQKPQQQQQLQLQQHRLQLQQLQQQGQQQTTCESSQCSPKLTMMTAFLFDTAPLQDAVSSRELKAYFKDPQNRAYGRWSSVYIVQVIGGFITACVTIVVYLIGDAAHWWNATNPVSIVIGALAGCAVIGFGVLACTAGAVAHFSATYRRIRFAQANDLSYRNRDIAVPSDGLIFDTGHERSIPFAYSARRQPGFDVFNYTYKTGSKGSQNSPDTETTHYWFVVRISMPRNVPHIVLDSASNNVFGTNLPVYFSKSQRLELEGDFNKYFTVYCSKSYERDALYILTPDVMAALVDVAGDLDIELIDDHLYAYQNDEINLDSPATWLRIAHIIDALGSEFQDQTRRYSDERAGDRTLNVVATEGRRLQRSWPIGVAFIGAIFAIAAIAYLMIH